MLIGEDELACVFQMINLICRIDCWERVAGRASRKDTKDREGRFYLVMVAGAGGESDWLRWLGRATRELGKGSVQHTNLERVSHLPSNCSLLRLSLASLCRANAWAFDPWQADLGELDALGESECRAGHSGTMCLPWLYRHISSQSLSKVQAPGFLGSH